MGAALENILRELVLSIVEYLPDDALLTLTTVSHAFRQLSIPLYLQRSKILTHQENYDQIRLCGDVPPRTVLLLSAMTFTSNLTISCDLYYVLEYMDVLDALWSSKAMSATIEIPDVDKCLLGHSLMLDALRAALSCLSHS